MAREYRLEGRVHFTGAVPESDLPKYYAACDVFLHPNRIDAMDCEGFGIVFLEAQAAGKPVIGGRTGGVPETMIEGETGFLVSAEDVAETSAVLQRLVENPELRNRMGQAARRHVANKFSWEAAARAAEDVHTQVVEAGTLASARGTVARRAASC
jgi:phosphatidylinositol alpha-1,6-mannosyltransferase